MSVNRLKQTPLTAFFQQRAEAAEPNPTGSEDNPVLITTDNKLDIKSEVPRDQTDDDDDDVVNIRGRRSRKHKTIRDDDDSSSSLEQPQPAKKHRQRTAHMTIGSDSEAEEDDETPGKKKSRRLVRRDEEEDDQEDLDFLDENDVYENRTRGQKQSQFSIALERLKDRKHRMEFGGSEGPLDRYRSDFDTDNEEDSDEEQDEDDDFVVADDIIDGVKVSPDTLVDIVDQETSALPAEFSAARMQRLSANFKIYVEYFVHLSQGHESGIQTAYFQTAVQAVERRIRGYTDSVLSSDAWLPRFKKALDRYPQWHHRNIASNLVCEGCRQNRPSTCGVVLAAEPEESEVEPRQLEFSLGSECYKRAKVYHRLVHFRSHTYKQVRIETERIRNAMNDADRGAEDLRLPEEIIKEMHNSGFTRKLYEQVRNLFSKVRFYYMDKSRRHMSESSSSDDDGEESES